MVRLLDLRDIYNSANMGVLKSGMSDMASEWGMQYRDEVYYNLVLKKEIEKTFGKNFEKLDEVVNNYFKEEFEKNGDYKEAVNNVIKKLDNLGLKTNEQFIFSIISEQLAKKFNDGSWIGVKPTMNHIPIISTLFEYFAGGGLSTLRYFGNEFGLYDYNNAEIGSGVDEYNDSLNGFLFVISLALSIKLAGSGDIMNKIGKIDQNVQNILGKDTWHKLNEMRGLWKQSRI